MNFMEEINALIEHYCDAIHTQNEEDFRSLWTGEETCIEISGTNMFKGVDAIYNDFVKGLIGTRYSSIILVNDGLDAYQLTEDTAVVVFAYHTDCIIRETGEKHGIQGLETQVLKRVNGEWKIAHIQYAGKPIENSNQ